MKPKSGKLVLAKMTNEHIDDIQHIEEVLQRTNRRYGRVLFDGTADSKHCYETAQRYNKRLLTPLEKLWQTLQRELGGKYATLSMIPEDLTLN